MFRSFLRPLLCFTLLAVLGRGPLAADTPAQEAAKKTEGAARDSRKAPGVGTVTGLIAHDADHPVAYAEVSLRRPDGTGVQTAMTDAKGRFLFERLPAGDYQVTYGEIGGETKTVPVFTLDQRRAAVDLGTLAPAGPVLELDKLQVRAKQQQFLNSVDRKVYNVGKEIQSTSGSAGDLLQNVPSVDVDIDGNVSLRGSGNVLILVNGRNSAMMGRSRAEVLQQLPASEIEKIEVITNPSAKYKPDGTSGIINIALKRKHTDGIAGTVNGSVGNRDRYNGGVSLNYRTGPWNLAGSVSLRQDDRPRFGSDVRSITDAVTGATIHADKETVEASRPFTRIARFGADYAPDKNTQYGVAGTYNRRTFHRVGTDTNRVTTGSGLLTGDYDRTRDDPEYEQDIEGSATYRHTFGEDHELNLELRHSDTNEQEDNHYANRYRTPSKAATFDNVLIQNSVHTTEGTIEYNRPLGDEASLETGYNIMDERYAANYRAEFADPASGAFVLDTTKSNRFRYNRTVNAFYATYGRAFGEFAVKAGLRPEFTRGESELLNTGAIHTNNYTRIYPTLHLSWRVAEGHELQLNYSHRVRRPEIDDLNPFPEYSDPFTLRAGNPNLKPEDIHSIEGGYSYHHDATSYTATLYDRRTYHGFTNITTDQGGGVLLTTHTNLATSNAVGFEFTANTDFGKAVTLNFSSNTFYNTIDASNLGFSASKSDVSWLAKLGLTLHPAKNTQLQVNTNYSSARLTPQGERRPTWVANFGVRQELPARNTALVLTVSDLFNSLKESNVLDTPLLHETVTRRRSARVVYLGFIYSFGAPAKKSKDDPLKFDNSL